MPTVHVVAQGETIVSISERYGFSARVIWDHPQNARLKAARQRMDVLSPGDEVVIPDRRTKTVSLPTDRRHVFRRRGIPALLRIVLREDGRARAGIEYRLVVSGREIHGRTDDAGLIRAHVPSGAEHGELYIAGEERPTVLRFGHMDPADTLSGVRKRLRNLGIEAPGDDDLDSEGWRGAIDALQLWAGLRRTGTLDEPTRAALLELHDRKGEAPR